MARNQDHLTSLLLVEGNDDFHVIHSLCKQFTIPVRNLENPEGGIFSVVECKGIDKLFEQIAVRFKSSQTISTIGVIIDADADLQSRWATLQDILKEIGFNLPKDFPNTGLVLQEGRLKVGVWIMPNNKLDGMLEDFISFLVPKDDKLLPIVHSTLGEIEKLQLNKYTPIHKSKAVIHSWLAWQEDPGTPMGLSITKRYLTTEEETCLLLIKWINELFNS